MQAASSLGGWFIDNREGRFSESKDLKRGEYSSGTSIKLMLRFFVAYSEQPGKSLIILYFLECQNKLEIRAEKCFLFVKNLFDGKR